MKSNQSRSERRICAIFPGALGDFICFLPALETLAREADVDLFARSEFAAIAPEGVHVRSLEASPITALFRAEPSAVNEHRSLGEYAAVYSWFASGSEEFVRRLGLSTGGTARFFPFRPATAATHQADYYLNCLGRAGNLPKPRIILREDALRWAEQFWREHALHQRAVMTMAPGSGAREKNWPEDFFLEVSRWWRVKTKGVVLLLNGPVERERGGTERLQCHCLVAADLTLSQAAALFSRSSVCLGNDSGMSHLAAAAGARAVALFGPTDTRRWAPRGDKVTVLRRGLGCSPCEDLVAKACSHHACLAEFSPREVIATIERLPEVVTLTR